MGAGLMKKNNDIKNKIQLDLLINEYMTPEHTPAATDLKKQLIKDLINKQISYIDIINYYYDIKQLNNK